MMNEIEIYQSDDGQTQVEVQFDQETVWLNKQQLAALFGRDRTVITRHINNIFKEGELAREQVCADFAHTTRHGSMSGKTQSRQMEYFNLDVIISVGYRVKSKRGTQFRIWATQRLKDYLVQGYAINERRLAQKEQEVRHLKDGIRILSRAIEQKAEDEDFTWLTLYAAGLRLLDDYDHECLDREGQSRKKALFPSYDEYMELIKTMSAEFDSAIFGQERGQGFKSAIDQIQQSFDGKELYPTFEEKAATLLYLVVKNHAFVDGNKRIAAACFLLFLDRNNRLHQVRDDEALTISNEALASLTLFVAASKPDEMETVKRLIISILNRTGKNLND